MNGLIWEAYQQNRIAKAEAAGERARDKVESVRSEINTLNRRLNSLTLCCQAFGELLRDNTNLTDEDLRAKIREVDARDGQLDHQIGAQPHMRQTSKYQTQYLRLLWRRIKHPSYL